MLNEAPDISRLSRTVERPSQSNIFEKVTAAASKVDAVGADELDRIVGTGVSAGLLAGVAGAVARGVSAATLGTGEGMAALVQAQSATVLPTTAIMEVTRARRVSMRTQ